MQELVVKRFDSFCHRLALNITYENGWPECSELLNTMVHSGEFIGLREIGLPRDHPRVSIKDELQYQIQRIMKEIEQLWISSVIHECLSQEQLEQRMAKDCGGVIPRGYSDALSLITEYYRQLEERVFLTLCSGIVDYDDEQLEVLIPHVDSEFYSRERVKQTYLSSSI